MVAPGRRRRNAGDVAWVSAPATPTLTAMTSSTWRWRLEPSPSASDPDLNPDLDPDLDGQRFPSQAEAETWLGETWRVLLDSGVERVVLLEGDREVYGPMDLTPASPL